MSKTISLKQFHSELQKCTACISYSKLFNEQYYSGALLPTEIFQNEIILPCNIETDPYACANECIQKFKDDAPCILIPGTSFDTNGTRHGRGGGWYDRFLSQLPKEWIRIGVISKEKFSKDALKREPWDEPVDWILIFDSITSSWDTVQAFPKRF